MRSSLAFPFALALFLLCSERQAVAESEPFFEKDFARSPSREVNGTDNTVPQHDDVVSEEGASAATAAPAAEAITPGAPATLEERVKSVAQGARDRSTQQARITPSAPSRQMTVALVGAVLDSTDPLVLVQQVEGMLKVLEKSKILISTIYAVGPIRPIPIRVRAAIANRQGRILFVDQLPKKYAMIKEAPSWIISSLDQEIIVEGAGPLSDNLTEKGEIIAQGDKVNPSATPNPAR